MTCWNCTWSSIATQIDTVWTELNWTKLISISTAAEQKKNNINLKIIPMFPMNLQLLSNLSIYNGIIAIVTVSNSLAFMRMMKLKKY